MTSWDHDLLIAKLNKLRNSSASVLTLLSISRACICLQVDYIDVFYLEPIMTLPTFYIIKCC